MGVCYVRSIHNVVGAVCFRVASRGLVKHMATVFHQHPREERRVNAALRPVCLAHMSHEYI